MELAPKARPDTVSNRVVPLVEVTATVPAETVGAFHVYAGS